MINRFNFVTVVFLNLFSNLVIAASCSDYRIDNSVNAKMLWQDLSVLSSDQMQGRKTQTLGAHFAREYISKRYAEIGVSSFSTASIASTNYKTPFVLEKSLGDIKGVNVVGYLTGSEFPDKYIVISAHYDHLGQKGKKIFNGADDNASGVSAMIAIANALTSKPARHSVIFLATDAEEQGLYGAKAFVKFPPVDLAKIKYNLNLDMLSQGGRRKRLYVSGDGSLKAFKPLVAEAAKEAGLCLRRGHRSSQSGFSGTGRMRWRTASDHAAFNRANIPFLFVGVSDHNTYHTENDTVENIDPDFHTAATETSLNILRKMDAL